MLNKRFYLKDLEILKPLGKKFQFSTLSLEHIKSKEILPGKRKCQKIVLNIDECISSNFYSSECIDGTLYVCSIEKCVHGREVFQWKMQMHASFSSMHSINERAVLH